MKKAYKFLIFLLIITNIIVFIILDNKRTFFTITPGIGLNIKHNKVFEIIYLNEESYISFGDLNIKGNTKEDAIKKITNTYIEMGFIDQYSPTNVINITTYIENEKKQKKYNKLIKNIINEELNKKNISTLIIENRLIKRINPILDKKGFTFNKTLMIEEVYQSTDLNKEVLEEKTYNKLFKILKTNSENIIKNTKNQAKKKEELTKKQNNYLKEKNSVFFSILLSKKYEEITKEELIEVQIKQKEAVIFKNNLTIKNINDKETITKIKNKINKR